MRRYKSNKEEFANGLFSTQLDKYYIPEFITILGLKNTDYNLFRMIYFYTDQNINGGYVTYRREEIAVGLSVSRGTVDKTISTLMKNGLIIREMVHRNGKLCPGYRVDKADIWRRIEEGKREESDTSQSPSTTQPLTSGEVAPLGDGEGLVILKGGEDSCQE